MLAQQNETQPVNALTLENIQKHLESTTINPFGYPIQWNPQQNPTQALTETIQQMKQSQAQLSPEQSQAAAAHLTASIHALKELKDTEPGGTASPEQKASFDLAWSQLEKARQSLCISLYERMRPLIGIIEVPPDLSSRPYMMKHGLWSKEDQC